MERIFLISDNPSEVIIRLAPASLRFVYHFSIHTHTHRRILYYIIKYTVLQGHAWEENYGFTRAAQRREKKTWNKNINSGKCQIYSVYVYTKLESLFFPSCRNFFFYFMEFRVYSSLQRSHTDTNLHFITRVRYFSRIITRGATCPSNRQKVITRHYKR